MGEGFLYFLFHILCKYLDFFYNEHTKEKYFFKNTEQMVFLLANLSKSNGAHNVRTFLPLRTSSLTPVCLSGLISSLPHMVQILAGLCVLRFLFSLCLLCSLFSKTNIPITCMSTPWSDPNAVHWPFCSSVSCQVDAQRNRKELTERGRRVVGFTNIYSFS